MEYSKVNQEISQPDFRMQGISFNSGTGFHVIFDNHGIIVKGNIQKGTKGYPVMTPLWNHFTSETAISPPQNQQTILI